MVYPALLPLMRTPRLPAVDWTDAPVHLNGLIRFAERRYLVSARVPSHFKLRTISDSNMVAVRNSFASDRSCIILVPLLWRHNYAAVWGQGRLLSFGMRRLVVGKINTDVSAEPTASFLSVLLWQQISMNRSYLSTKILSRSLTVSRGH